MAQFAALGPVQPGGLYESGCYGRWGRIEAKTIDDKATKAHGPYCWQTSNGTYPQPSQTSRYYRGSNNCPVFSKQHRTLFRQRFAIWYAHYLLTRGCSAGNRG